MFIAKVVGNVVSTQKNEKLIGTKLLLVKPIDDNGSIIKNGEVIVAVDTAGAGKGELVLVAKGSAARHVYDNKTIPADAAIVGIVDSIEYTIK